MTVHWGIDDPAAVEGSKEDQARAFQRALGELDARITRLLQLPLESLDQTALREKLEEIGI